MHTRKEIYEKLFPRKQQSKQRFVPFVQERNQIGRIIRNRRKTIVNSSLDLALGRARTVVKKYYAELQHQRKNSASFQLKSISNLSPQLEQKIKFQRLKKHKSEVQKAHLQRRHPRLLLKNANKSIHPFYQRLNYQKFYHKNSPSFAFSKAIKRQQKRVSLQRQESVSVVEHFSGKDRDEARKSKEVISRISMKLNEKEQQHRLQLSKLQPKFYYEVEQELRKMENRFEDIKLQALLLKSGVGQLHSK